MNVRELLLRLAECDPDKEVLIDPPYSSVSGVYERSDKDVVELRH